MIVQKRSIVEARLLLKLTGPLLLAQLSQTAMGFVDTVMAGRYSSLDLAAVAVGASIFFPLYLFMVGLLSAVTPLTAQAHGRGDRSAVQAAIQQGAVVGLGVGLLMTLLMHHLDVLLSMMQVSPEVIPLTSGYLRALSWGMPIAGVFLALRSGAEGLSLPRLSMLAGFFGLTVNIIANYLLIYGKMGLPALGGVGCGWATSLSMVAMFAAMTWLLSSSRAAQASPLFTSRAPKLFRSLGQLVQLGLPIGLALFVECSIFSVIALLIAKFGAEVVAAHQIALNFTSLLFMMPYSLSIALTIRVGFAIGKGQPSRVARIVRTGLVLALCSAVTTGLFILTFSRQIAAMYSPDLAVQQLAVVLLVLAALFQLPDAIQVNCAGALRGFKDTRVPMILMVLAYWGIGLPVGWSFGLGGLGGMEPGPQGFWIGLICGLTTSATLLGIRLSRMVKQTVEGSLSGSK